MDRDKPDSQAGADSLAPVSHPLSAEAEASLMNRGRGRQLFAFGGAVVLLVAGFGLMVHKMGQSAARAEAASAAAQLEREYFEGFFGCALPEIRPSQLATAQRVHSAFYNLGERFGTRYARTLESCAPQLGQLERRLKSLQVPDEARASYKSLVSASDDLSSSQRRYLDYLIKADRYDYVKAAPAIDKLSNAWLAYREASADLQRSLTTR